MLVFNNNGQQKWLKTVILEISIIIKRQWLTTIIISYNNIGNYNTTIVLDNIGGDQQQ